MFLEVDDLTKRFGGLVAVSGVSLQIEEGEIVCPLHMARFDLRTGRPLCLPAMVALQTFAVEIDDGRVYVTE